jgi:hypothetical protein
MNLFSLPAPIAQKLNPEASFKVFSRDRKNQGIAFETSFPMSEPGKSDEVTFKVVLGSVSDQTELYQSLKLKSESTPEFADFSDKQVHKLLKATT